MNNIKGLPCSICYTHIDRYRSNTVESNTAMLERNPAMWTGKQETIFILYINGVLMCKENFLFKEQLKLIVF